MCFTYQDDGRQVRVACGNNWQDDPATVVRTISGTPLSLIPLTNDDGRNITSVNELRLFYFTDTDVRIYFFNLRI